MLRRHYSLILVAIWLFIGAALIAPERVLPDAVLKQVRIPAGTLAGVMAMVFAAYNFVRWWALQSLHRTRTAANPLAVRKFDDEEKYDPNPDLDFFKRPDGT